MSEEFITICVGILEDEKKYILDYQTYLQNWKSDTKGYTLDIFTNDDELLQRAAAKKYDILFLDNVIKDNIEAGAEVARELRKQGYKNLIVFVSHIVDFWAKGYKVKAHDYYVKPLQYDDFCNCMEAARNKILGKNFRYSFKEEYKLIPYDEIFYFTVQGHYANIHTANGVFKMLASMSKLKLEVPNCFLQCHRSFLVNLDNVDKFFGNEFNMKNGETVYISQTYLPDVRREFLRWLR